MTLPDYCTVDDVNLRLDDAQLDTAAHADLIAALITRASRFADTYTGREDGAYKAGTAAVRRFEGEGKSTIEIDEMAAAPTVVEVAEGGVVDHSGNTGGVYTAWAASDYWVWPDNRPPYTMLEVAEGGSKSAWPKGKRTVRVTAQWGYSLGVPGPITEAVTIIVVRSWKRGAQMFQDASASIDAGQLLYVKQLDPEAKAILDRFIRHVYVA